MCGDHEITSSPFSSLIHASARHFRFAVTRQQFAVALNCHTAALAAATSAGVSLLVPFFGGDDDIAALLLALAIVERDSTAELVILSFLEPEKPPTGGGAINEGDGNESRREVGQVLRL